MGDLNSEFSSSKERVDLENRFPHGWEKRASNCTFLLPKFDCPGGFQGQGEGCGDVKLRMGRSRCPRCLVCSSHLCCSDHNLFFQSAERLCWIEFCYHIKHRSKWSHHSLQVRETQLLLSTFSKLSWNELSGLFMESQQSTPGRWCLLSFFTPHLLRSFPAGNMHVLWCWSAQGHRKGLFWGWKSGKYEYEVPQLFWNTSRNRCFCWKRQSSVL